MTTRSRLTVTMKSGDCTTSFEACKGFKDHDAAEVTAMTDPNVLDTKTESEVDELVDMLKIIKGGYY